MSFRSRLNCFGTDLLFELIAKVSLTLFSSRVEKKNQALLMGVFGEAKNNGDAFCLLTAWRSVPSAIKTGSCL